MQNKQCICPECGSIAEVRRQSNGKKLRYMVCINGHGGLQTRKDAAKWEELEQDRIGEYGSMPEPQPIKPELKSPTTLEVVTDDWEPTEESPLKTKEVEQKVDKLIDGLDKTGLPIFAKVGLLALGVFGIGGAALYANNKKRGAL